MRDGSRHTRLPGASGGSAIRDGSAHRIISDLSAFIGNADHSTHRILAADDLNLIYESNTSDPQALEERGNGVFQRFKTIGLEMVGPQYPAGRKAAQIPNDLPLDMENVPTYYTRAECPATATRQLDYVFASRGFHERVTVHALNEVEHRGPSDHFRMLIEVDRYKVMARRATSQSTKNPTTPSSRRQ